MQLDFTRASVQIEMLGVLSATLHANESWQLRTVPANDNVPYNNMSLNKLNIFVGVAL